MTIRKHKKKRIFYPLGKDTCEIDVYLDDMLGYVRAEIEFDNLDDMRNFIIPEWFGDEITKVNHSIHENLGAINLNTMISRFKENNIHFTPVYL